MTQELMQAVVCHGPFDYRVEEVARPEPGSGELLVKVGAAGICGSDIHCFRGNPASWGANGSGGYVEAPVIGGHEFAGTVVALGDGADLRHQVALGDYVLAEEIIPCGQCRYCKCGKYWMCEVNIIFGFKRGRGEGGWAEYMIYPANAVVHKVDARLSMPEAAYIEPLACAMHAVDRAEIRPGDVVVIAGVGCVGLCALQAAKQYNPGQLIALDTSSYRLDLARELGADAGINPLEEDAVARVKSLTEGFGCDVFIEMTGNAKVPPMALEMIRRLGTIVPFSVMVEPTTIDWTLLGDGKELNVHGSHLGPYCYPKAIRAVAEGKIDVRRLVSAQFPLAEFPTAMEAAQDSSNLKTMLVP